MADVYEAYQFLNNELSLGLSKQQMVRAETRMKVEVGAELDNKEIVKNPQDYEFFFVPVSSDLLRAYRVLKASANLDVSDEQLVHLSKKYAMKREGQAFKAGLNYAAFLTKRNHKPTEEREITWAQTLMEKSLPSKASETPSKIMSRL